jgi:hypothetical protein
MQVGNEWKILNNEGLCDLFIFPSIIRVDKSRLYWAGNSA